MNDLVAERKYIVFPFHRISRNYYTDFTISFSMCVPIQYSTKIYSRYASQCCYSVTFQSIILKRCNEPLDIPIWCNKLTYTSDTIGLIQGMLIEIETFLHGQ